MPTSLGRFHGNVLHAERGNWHVKEKGEGLVGGVVAHIKLFKRVISKLHTSPMISRSHYRLLCGREEKEEVEEEVRTDQGELLLSLVT